MAPLPSARADEELSFQYFYDTLSPYGEWVDVADYGSCWHPTEVDKFWAPYQDGYWANSDAGWTWVSSEPFGDIVYHYGRWVSVDDLGWCWVPGYDWAPAWVSWRTSESYVGWAALPPEAGWQQDVGVGVWADERYDIGPRSYHFCRVKDFCDSHLRRVCLPWQENARFIFNTENVTNIAYDGDRHCIFNGGPDYVMLREHSERPIPFYHFVEREGGKNFRSVVHGNEMEIFRPRLAPDVHRGRDLVQGKIEKTISREHVNHGWHGIANEVERKELRSTIKEQVRGLTQENSHAKPHVEESRKTEIHRPSQGKAVEHMSKEEVRKTVTTHSKEEIIHHPPVAEKEQELKPKKGTVVHEMPPSGRSVTEKHEEAPKHEAAVHHNAEIVHEKKVEHVEPKVEHHVTPQPPVHLPSHEPAKVEHHEEHHVTPQPQAHVQPHEPAKVEHHEAPSKEKEKDKKKPNDPNRS